ncbi:hypothetical protein CFP56_003907 [Quercus suber]|uniref:Uncharacterized protein n=1 Tax=Quercus suber TaxID=58331 RepID=A0AAW0LB57_QUESU
MTINLMSLPILALLPQSVPLIFSTTKMTLMTSDVSSELQSSQDGKDKGRKVPRSTVFINHSLASTLKKLPRISVHRSTKPFIDLSFTLLFQDSFFTLHVSLPNFDLALRIQV